METKSNVTTKEVQELEDRVLINSINQFSTGQHPFAEISNIGSFSIEYRLKCLLLTKDMLGLSEISTESGVDVLNGLIEHYTPAGRVSRLVWIYKQGTINIESVALDNIEIQTETKFEDAVYLIQQEADKCKIDQKDRSPIFRTSLDGHSWDEVYVPNMDSYATFVSHHTSEVRSIEHNYHGVLELEVIYFHKAIGLQEVH
jgi:hypothetical protein